MAIFAIGKANIRVRVLHPIFIHSSGAKAKKNRMYTCKMYVTSNFIFFSRMKYTFEMAEIRESPCLCMGGSGWWWFECVIALAKTTKILPPTCLVAKVA